MVSKIALEEHFGATDPNIVEQSAEHFQADAWPAHRDMLLDIHEERIRIMESCEIEKTVLSLLAPGIQSLYESKQAVDLGPTAQRLCSATGCEATRSVRVFRRAPHAGTRRRRE